MKIIVLLVLIALYHGVPVSIIILLGLGLAEI